MISETAGWAEAVKQVGRQARTHKKYLRQLIVATETAISAIEKTMVGPSTPERGQQIAAIVNALELQKDIAKRFGLKP